VESGSEELKTKKPEIFEEKKEDIPTRSLINDDEIRLSDVATRLWCFFVAYNNPKDPQDNYLRQVEAVLEDVDFDTVSQLIDLEVPSYAVEYMAPGVSNLGLTMRDIASPKVKELFESHYYFLGRFEFLSELDGVLIHRSPDNDTLWIKAMEHVVQTTEYEAPKIVEPGVSEESIWKTGEILHDEEGYVASRFKDSKRQVYFKFTRNKMVYENEVLCRADIGMRGDESPANVLPLLGHFNASGDTVTDRRYLMDVNDERFNIIRSYGGEKIRLSDFPFALVHPYCDGGDLFDYFFHHGMESMSEVSRVALQICKAVKAMHDKKIILASLSMRNFVIAPVDDADGDDAGIKWVLSDLSGVCRNHQSAYMGAVTSDGSVQFETGLMPPEMFTKLSPSEEEICKEYWDKVEELYGVKVDRKVVEPIVDANSGNSYVLRCHYVPDNRQKIADGELPELPYMLVPARESTDLWCFGLLLYCMCSGGRPLFPTNVKSGHLLEHSIVNWSKDAARASVYEHVTNTVAQDVLLQLLSSYEIRNSLDFGTIMSHPFFSNDISAKSLEKLVEKRQGDCAAYTRNRTHVVHEKCEDDWLKSRTVVVHCWNFDELKKFHFSSSEIIRRLTLKENGMPSSFLLLPYKLSAKNKKAKLAPTTKKDVERAERMGVLLLALAKACHFGVSVEHTITEASARKKWDAVTLLESVKLPAGQYEDLHEEFTGIAADRIEAFRSDPMSAVMKLIERRYFEIRSFFKDAGKAFLYLVDEYGGVPAVGPAFEPYPLEISESAMSKMLAKILPFMHCSSMCVRGISRSASGIVRLIFEAAYPHVPPSWATAATGLNHSLDEDLIQKEVLILHRALSGLNISKSRRSLSDDLGFIRESCSKADVKGDFGTMKRVQCGGHSLWTTPSGVETIQEACKNYDFKQAMEIQAQLESKLKSQDDLIAQLQDKIEWLSFRKELNLKMPADSSLSTHSASVTRKFENTGHISISTSSHSGGIIPSLSITSSQSTPIAGTPSSKYTNAIDSVTPRKSAIVPRSTPRKASGGTLSAQSRDSSKHAVLRSDEVDADDNVPLDEMTVTSESTKDTFRDHIELD
jgi:serine/threonine protein kinase